MAPPAPPVAKATPGGLLKKVPPWGWAIGAGGVLGVGYTLYKGRRTAPVAGPPAGEEDLPSEYDLVQQPAPGGAYYPSTPIIAEPAETVGAVGQTAIESVVGGITGVIESLPVLIAALPFQEYEAPIINVELPQSPAPAPAPIPTPADPPAAAPTPGGVTILGRRFANAISYKEASHPGRGRTFDVRFAHKVEKWETWETVPGAIGNRPMPKPQRKWRKMSTNNI